MEPVELQNLLRANNGIVTNKLASEIGISRERLRLLVNAGELERETAG